jgi:histidinol-phosphate aminotransferase
VSKLKKYWSRLAGGLVPYVPGEQPKDRKYIKLNTNENPYGPSPKVIEAIKAAADDSLKLYPDPTCDELVKAAADYYGVPKEMIFTGNGSDEVLAFAFMAFFEPGREILFADITYSFYPVYANLFNLNYRLIPLDDGFRLNEEDYFNSPGGVIIANPNAPTGNCLSLETIRRVLENNSENVVIIDEAYIDFGGESAVGLTREYPNLLVVHTFSKSRSLAGMRLGFAIGDSSLIEALQSVKNSFNSYTLDRLAIKAGVEAFRDNEYFEETRNRIIATRKRTVATMAQMGFNIPDSSANFIFAAHPEIKGEYIFNELRSRGILVRYFKKPRIDNHLRISIGSDDEMECLLKALREIIKS